MIPRSLTRGFRITSSISRLSSAHRVMSDMKPNASNGTKRPFHNGQHRRPKFNSKKMRRRERAGGGPTTEQVLDAEITSLMEGAGLDENDVQHVAESGTEVDVIITHLSATGDGLGRAKENPSEIFAVSFAIPGDVVRVKVHRQVDEPVPYTAADLINVIEPSPDRNDDLIRCKYFAKCSGCQLQMVPYAKQLEYKRAVIERAFQHFSSLPPELVPTIGEVRASPLQYGYRTKLTPHFSRPQSSKKTHDKDVNPPANDTPLAIGFNKKIGKSVLDIEECPVGSEILNLGMTRERKRVLDSISSFKNGATLLLRESSRRIPRSDLDPSISIPSSNIDLQTVYSPADNDHVLAKTCITDSKAFVREFIDDFEFRNEAGSFFQNNNSILSSFTEYVRKHVTSPRKYKNLIDAYCGSGLFSITLSSCFERTIGIDIDKRSIEAAEDNMTLNAAIIPKPRRSSSPTVAFEELTRKANEDEKVYTNIHSKGVHFIAADAAQLFSSVSTFEPSETAVILDPPRKGCDEPFLKQLLAFAPDRIIYVSCNVHTQAKDLGFFLRGGKTGRKGEDVKDPPYKIDSLIGFDFFPQTSHVEGVAVLTRVKKEHVSVASEETTVASGLNNTAANGAATTR